MSRTLTMSRLVLAALAALASGFAFAHVDAGTTVGFVHGFGHPLGGVDHLLAMVAVGIFAAGLGGTALWAVPLAFMAFMLVGGAMGIGGIGVPLVEAGIALSIVVLGTAVALRRPWPMAAAMAMVALFAIFHGHAHGTEMPANASGVAYAFGFVGATGLLHLVGIVIGLGIGRAGAVYAPRLTQVGGAAVAVAGVGVLVGMF